MQGLVNKLKGIYTIESIMEKLNVSRQTAIIYVHRLRKKGYVKTKKLSNNKRVYHISLQNRLRGVSYYDIINTYAPIKLSTTEIHQIYGRKPSLEEALIYAIKTQRLRAIIAAMSLFKHISHWSELYRLAKKNHLERQVGALYDLARKVMKTRRMTYRYRNNALPKDVRWRYLIPEMKSKDFRDIEKMWKIYLPFNYKDLEVYLT